jgi:hypothetical protein
VTRGGRTVGVALVAVLAVTTPVSASGSGPAPVVKGIPPLTAVAGAAAQPADSGLSYYYVYDRVDATASGASGRFTVAQPAVPSPDLHSLAELAVESSDGQQIVEEGWTVDPGQFGDSLPHLFVFHWVDGQPACYDACGFVSTSASVTAGMPLTPGDVHTFRIRFSKHNWNVYDGKTRVGYFPASLWSGSFAAVGLTQWFGEVAATSTPPCAQMGNGLFASDPDADSIRHLALIDGPSVSTSPLETDAADYTGEAISGTGLRLGGPGGCGPQPQIITFTSTAPSDAVAGGAGYMPTASGGASGNPVVFTIADGSAEVCVLQAGVVSFVGPGRCVIQANQDGDAAFTPAAQVTQGFRVRLQQTITFVSRPPRHARVGGPAYRPRANGGQSGKPVVFAVGPHTRHVCGLHHRKVHFHAKGTCVIHATQAGNATYAPAPRQTQRFTVHRH